MTRSLAAFTAPGCSYPEYISVNQEPDGLVTIIVRSPAVAHESKKFQVPGPQASVTMTPEAFQLFLLSCAKEFRA